MNTDSPDVVYFERVNGKTVHQGEAMLYALYQEFNASRFNGALPAPVISIIDASGDMARFDLVHGVPRLSFSPFFSFQSDRLNRMMLHLMCHFFDQSHGDTFQGKLREVMAGDLWLRDEIDKATVLALHAARSTAALAVVERLAARDPRMTWWEARRQVARELKTTVRATHSFLPHFETTWAAIEKAKTRCGRK